MSFEKFIKVNKTLSNSYVEEWKKQGKKIIGYYCSYIPEEILVSGGIFPFRMRATEAEGTSRADTILSRFNCSFVRASLDLAMQGKYNFLDGLVVMNSCDHARRMYDIWKYKIIGKFEGIEENFGLFFISLPHIITERGYNWLLEEFTFFKENLEKTYNIKISE